MYLSCDKKTNDEWIPYVPVNIALNTSDPLFVKLNAPGGWVYINGGSRGIIVIRTNQTDFKAFDRHCPYNPKSACGKINVDNSQVLATDSCCGSQFVILDGSISKGPATRPLREYQTIYDGNRLSVTN